MPRKPNKGYFVKGQFVNAGSALDLEFKRALKGTVERSKTELKRSSAELQKLGTEMLTLRPEFRRPLNLPATLTDALDQAQGISDFEGRRRQLQYIGKLMRQLEPEVLSAARAALLAQHQPQAHEREALHSAEQWRARLLAHDAALAQWMQLHPQTDAQRLRALVRQARKDQAAVGQGPSHSSRTQAQARSQGLAPRQGRAYREIFHQLRTHLMRPQSDSPQPDSPQQNSEDHHA